MDNNCCCQGLCTLYLYAVAHVSKCSSQTRVHCYIHSTFKQSRLNDKLPSELLVTDK